MRMTISKQQVVDTDQIRKESTVLGFFKPHRTIHRG